MELTEQKRKVSLLGVQKTAIRRGNNNKRKLNKCSNEFYEETHQQTKAPTSSETQSGV
jgi:hypothetical protein